MVMCRPRPEKTEVIAANSRVFHGGPVFVTRRKPSAFAETLLAELKGQESSDKLGDELARPVALGY